MGGVGLCSVLQTNTDTSQRMVVKSILTGGWAESTIGFLLLISFSRGCHEDFFKKRVVC